MSLGLGWGRRWSEGRAWAQAAFAGLRAEFDDLIGP